MYLLHTSEPLLASGAKLSQWKPKLNPETEGSWSCMSMDVLSYHFLAAEPMRKTFDRAIRRRAIHHGDQWLENNDENTSKLSLSVKKP